MEWIFPFHGNSRTDSSPHHLNMDMKHLLCTLFLLILTSSFSAHAHAQQALSDRDGIPITPKQFKANSVLSVGMHYDMHQRNEEQFDPLIEAHTGHLPSEMKDAIRDGRKTARTLNEYGNGLLEMNVVTKGILYYDYPNKKMATNVSEIDASINVGALKFDFQMLGQGGVILRYDQHRNYTWGILPTGAEICMCQQMNGTMQPIHLPDGAVFVRTIDDYVGPDRISKKVDVYTVELPRGSVDIPYVVGIEVDFQLTWYVDVYTEPANPVVLKFNASMNCQQGGLGLRLDIVHQLYNTVSGQPVLSVFEVDPKICPCDAPPVINPLPPNPGQCPLPPHGCTCADTLPQYCTGLVNYPTDPAVDLDITDQYVQASVNSAKAVFAAYSDAMSPQCEAEMKKFYCLFHFPRCTKDSVLTTPRFPRSLEVACGAPGRAIIDGTAKNVGTAYDVTAQAQSSTSFLSDSSNSDTVRSSSPFQAYRSANEKALTAGEIAAIIIGSVIAIAAISAAVSVVQYRHRSGRFPWEKQVKLLHGRDGGTADANVQYSSTV